LRRLKHCEQLTKFHSASLQELVMRREGRTDGFEDQRPRKPRRKFRDALAEVVVFELVAVGIQPVFRLLADRGGPDRACQKTSVSPSAGGWSFTRVNLHAMYLNEFHSVWRPPRSAPSPRCLLLQLFTERVQLLKPDHEQFFPGRENAEPPLDVDNPHMP
jgi:hypothetical protein